MVVVVQDSLRLLVHQCSRAEIHGGTRMIEDDDSGQRSRMLDNVEHVG